MESERFLWEERTEADSYSTLDSRRLNPISLPRGGQISADQKQTGRPTKGPLVACFQKLEQAAGPLAEVKPVEEEEEEGMQMAASTTSQTAKPR